MRRPARIAALAVSGEELSIDRPPPAAICASGSSTAGRWALRAEGRRLQRITVERAG
jgi:hypothetical protein